LTFLGRPGGFLVPPATFVTFGAFGFFCAAFVRTMSIDRSVLAGPLVRCGGN